MTDPRAAPARRKPEWVHVGLVALGMLVGALVATLTALGFGKGLPGWRLDRLETAQIAASAERQELRDQLGEVLGELRRFRIAMTNATNAQDLIICALSREHQDLSDMACHPRDGNRVPGTTP